MGENLKVRTFVVALLTAVSLWLVGKPLVWDRKSPLTLGLDIQGGVNLRYEFRKDELPSGTTLAETIEVAQLIFSNRLDEYAVKELSVRKIGDSQIEVAVPGITMEQSGSIKSRLESIGRLEMRLESWTEPGIKPIEQRERLEEAIKTRKEKGEEITAATDFSSLTENTKLGGTGVTFRWKPKSSKLLADELKREAKRTSTPERKASWDVASSWVLVRWDDRAGQHFTGDQVKSVYPTTDDQSGTRAAGFIIRPGRDAQQFADWTEKNQKQSIVTLLDDQVQSIAVIEGRIEGSGIIRGGEEGFTADELKHLISVIKSGSLKVKPHLVQGFEQGPSLGEESIRLGIQATLVSFVIVAGFMLVYYRLNGFVAVVALVCNLLLLVAAMVWLDATLTLPGVAGLILTIGMAVDANILISERVREEQDKGKTVAQAVKNGFDRAYVTIFDSNLTTFITGFFLYQFGTGAIKGFAVTLMIGLATSMLTGVYFSRTIFEVLLRRGLKKLSMLRLLSAPNLRFLSYSKSCFTVSLLLILVGCGLFIVEDRDKYGMDFTGGFEVQIDLKEPARQADVLERVNTKYATADVVSIEAAGELAHRFQIKSKHVAPAAAPDGGAANQDPRSPADRFAADISALFADRLVEPGIQNLTLGEADPQTGRVEVACDLKFTANVARTAVETALRRNVNDAAIAGPDVGDRFKLTGHFTRAPASVEVARGLLSPKLKTPDGKDAQLSDPLPARSYVGERAGKELRTSAIQAMLLSLGAIVLYARMRFSQYRYGIAAVVALIHDVLVSLGAFGIARTCGYPLEVDLTVVAAFLTIIGFSVNDTIVLFDRIRENLPRQAIPLRDLVDRSCNQTLSRTILTSTTVFLAALILFLHNVGQRNALEAFAFTMMVGVLTGTYSTIYVASVLLVHVAEWVEKRKSRPKAPPPPTPAAAAV